MVTAGNIIMISTICGPSFILLAYVYGSTCLLSTPVIWCPGFSIWNAFVSWFQQLECVSAPVIWSNCPVMPTDDPLHVGTSNIIGGHVFNSTTSTSEESANQVLGSLPKKSIPENFTTNHPFGRIHEMLPVFVISYTSMHLEALHMFVISYKSMQGPKVHERENNRMDKGALTPSIAINFGLDIALYVWFVIQHKLVTPFNLQLNWIVFIALFGVLIIQARLMWKLPSNSQAWTKQSHLILGFKKIGVYSSFFRIFKAPNKHVVLMCSNARSSSSKRELYKPSFAGFVDVDLANNKKLSLKSLRMADLEQRSCAQDLVLQRSCNKDNVEICGVGEWVLVE
ncbi:hypothetical protein JHK87_004696 [Glycine soja]|nr:hypothetical protein JHK87_004696 [Glycine soja]